MACTRGKGEICAQIVGFGTKGYQGESHRERDERRGPSKDQRRSYMEQGLRPVYVWDSVNSWRGSNLDKGNIAHRVLLSRQDSREAKWDCIWSTGK